MLGRNRRGRPARAIRIPCQKINTSTLGRPVIADRVLLGALAAGARLAQLLGVTALFARTRSLEQCVWAQALQQLTYFWRKGLPHEMPIHFA
jgi:hypothetical protein